MNCLWSVFMGAGYTGPAGARSQRVCDTLAELRQVRDRLCRRCALVTRKVADEERDIIELNLQRKARPTLNRDSPIMSRLRRHVATRRLYNHGVAGLENAIFLLERQIHLLEEAGFQHETLGALRQANVAGDQQRKLIESMDLDKLLDSIQENHQTLEETNHFFSDVEAFHLDVEDEEALEQELASLLTQQESVSTSPSLERSPAPPQTEPQPEPQPEPHSQWLAEMF